MIISQELKVKYMAIKIKIFKIIMKIDLHNWEEIG